MNHEAKYTIKTVSKLTGLSTHLIRAWERRYRVLNPKRTDTNRRLYSDDDVAKLQLLSQAVTMGFNIGSIAGFSADKLKSIISHPTLKGPVPDDGALSDYSPSELKKMPPPSAGELQVPVRLAAEYLRESIDSIINYNSEKLKDILLKASIDLSQRELLEWLVIPLIYDIGDKWQNGTLRIAQEHLASSVILNFLQHLRGMYKNANDSPVLISATPQGEFHELGALMISAVAASAGWNVVHLGTNLPVEELISAAKDSDAKVICLSLVYPESDLLVSEYLQKLYKSQIYSQGVHQRNKARIVIGGKAARSYINVIKNKDILLIDKIGTFRTKLNGLR